MWDLLVEWWTAYGEYVDGAGHILTFGLFLGGMLFALYRKCKKDEAAGKKDDGSDYITGILVVSIIAGFFWKFALSALFFWWLFSVFSKDETKDKTPTTTISLTKDAQ